MSGIKIDGQCRNCKTETLIEYTGIFDKTYHQCSVCFWCVQVENPVRARLAEMLEGEL